VRFLVDENLSVRLCQFLTTADDTAEHVRDAIGAGASDHVVLEDARERAAVIVTADTDFGTLAVRSGMSQPSIILMRELLALTVDGRASCWPRTWTRYATL
jgi:predicted nuclease of predicted toxin-antitoxin system